MLDELQRKPLTVSQAAALAKAALEACTVTLVGEVSEVSNKPGYKAVYFTVKDTGASMPCMMWMNRFKSTGVDLRVGSLVQLTGRFTLYAPKGRMNFDVFSLSLAGEGDLRQRVADLARKLQGEGLMDPSRKQLLPRFPQVIGLVTSPRGAAVHDVLRTLRRRYPAARVVLAGVPVEGTSAPAALTDALRAVCEAGAQEVLLVRGGGSFEDLMPFNDESLARAVASSPVPVITGIGHEPDTSIVDMVADLRASTPTAAAEAAAPDMREMHAELRTYAERMDRAASRSLERRTMLLDRLGERPLFQDPHTLLAADAQMLDMAGDRLQRAIPGGLARDEAALDSLRVRLVQRGHGFIDPFETAMRMDASRLNDLSPLAVLGRGFALAKDENGSILRSVDEASVGKALDVVLADGSLACRVEALEHADTMTIPWKEEPCQNR
jgi:exodeoxyribonuclease VII large subunit